MCDKHADGFAAELASRVRQTWKSGSADTDDDAPDPEEMERVMLCLETHLQHLVLQKFGTGGQASLVLTRWPLPLQHVRSPSKLLHLHCTFYRV